MLLLFLDLFLFPSNWSGFQITWIIRRGKEVRRRGSEGGEGGTEREETCENFLSLKLKSDHCHLERRKLMVMMMMKNVSRMRGEEY